MAATFSVINETTLTLPTVNSNDKNNPKYISWPGSSKLTMSLVFVSLKFQTLKSQICQYFFFLKKCEKLLQCKSFSHFFNKNISVFGYKVVKHLMSWLTML